MLEKYLGRARNTEFIPYVSNTEFIPYSKKEMAIERHQSPFGTAFNNYNLVPNKLGGVFILLRVILLDMRKEQRSESRE